MSTIAAGQDGRNNDFRVIAEPFLQDEGLPFAQALSADDVRYYTVRAESSDAVLSLIPRLGLCPSGDYDSVDLARCPQVLVPAGPPAMIDNLWPEVVL